MIITAISDLHGCVNLDDLDIRGNLLCIAGDFIPLNVQSNDHKSKQWIRDILIPWTDKLDVDKVILVAGNHDWICLNSNVEPIFKDTKIKYLQDSGCDYDIDNTTYHIWGTPWCTRFYDWAFMESSEFIKSKYELIPEETDILITHMPPKLNNLGKIEYGVDAGSEELAEVMLEKKPLFSMCGHIHTGNHNLEEYTEGCFATNVSLLNEQYLNVYSPRYFEISKNNVFEITD